LFCWRVIWREGFGEDGRMTRLLLIRHALVSGVGGKIAGRSEGVSLAPAGYEQAGRLKQLLAGVDIAAIYSSPQQRARETADALAGVGDQAVRIAAELDELDYGDWTGRRISELNSVPQWQAFNSVRSCTRIPNGELILEVQARAIGFMEQVAARHPEQCVAIVTHGDVIRAVLAYYLGLPLDLMLRLEISPASVSIVRLEPLAPVIVCVNHTEPLCAM
jgi:probable phosphomutase (TIGR03848 family)